ncbi:MAG: prepilin-type N-terminal cleavage/methylation domain-containing protein [Kofleriaceae bacterium]
MSGTRPANRSAQAGFTMVECLVAILLMAISTSGLLALYMSQTRAAGYSRHATEATVLAQDQLERLRTTAAPGVTTTGTQAGLNEKGQVVSGGLFTRSWTSTPVLSYVDVAVTVTWNEDGATKNVVLRTRRNL